MLFYSSWTICCFLIKNHFLVHAETVFEFVKVFLVLGFSQCRSPYYRNVEQKNLLELMIRLIKMHIISKISIKSLNWGGGRIMRPRNTNKSFKPVGQGHEISSATQATKL